MSEHGKVLLRPRRMGRAVCQAAFCALLLAGCRGVLGDYDYTREKPNESELIGVWVPDAETARLMAREGRYESAAATKLELKQSGLLEIKDMPDWWFDPFGKSGKSFAGVEGGWTLLKDSEGAWKLHLRVPRGPTSLDLYGQKPPYRLEANIGDPDSGISMTFVKRDGDAPPVRGGSP